MKLDRWALGSSMALNVILVSTLIFISLDHHAVSRLDRELEICRIEKDKIHNDRTRLQNDRARLHILLDRLSEHAGKEHD